MTPAEQREAARLLCRLRGWHEERELTSMTAWHCTDCHTDAELTVMQRTRVDNGFRWPA